MHLNLKRKVIPMFSELMIPSGKFKLTNSTTLKRERDPAKCDHILQLLNDQAASGENLMPTVIKAVEADCTLGEIADTLREVFGEYKG